MLENKNIAGQAVELAAPQSVRQLLYGRAESYFSPSQTMVTAKHSSSNR